MKAATACFTTVTLRLQQLFRRLPRSHLGSEKLQVLKSFRHKARLACGRSRLLQLGVFGGCWGAEDFPTGKGLQEPLAAWYRMLSSALLLGQPDLKDVASPRQKPLLAMGFHSLSLAGN